MFPSQVVTVGLTRSASIDSPLLADEDEVRSRIYFCQSVASYERSGGLPHSRHGFRPWHVSESQFIHAAVLGCPFCPLKYINRKSARPLCHNYFYFPIVENSGPCTDSFRCLFFPAAFDWGLLKGLAEFLGRLVTLGFINVHGFINDLLQRNRDINAVVGTVRECSARNLAVEASQIGNRGKIILGINCFV